MSTQEKKLYKEIEIKANKRPSAPVESRAYKGISTVNSDNNSFNLYDIALIKQDIINHFHIRQGEKLENPEFGTIIWDVLFDPLTESLKSAITENVESILKYDPRVSIDNIIVDEYESGIQIECVLVYLDYSIAETMRLQFDQENGLLS